MAAKTTGKHDSHFLLMHPPALGEPSNACPAGPRILFLRSWLARAFQAEVRPSTDKAVTTQQRTDLLDGCDTVEFVLAGTFEFGLEKIMSDGSRDEWPQVEVWRFRRYDFRAGQYVTSIGKAEISAIAAFGAEAIPGSMECVPQHRLDGNGIYMSP
ncbi:MAG: hypothetical protein ABI520_16815, partial [Caldimonas sp.]